MDRKSKAFLNCARERKIQKHFIHYNEKSHRNIHISHIKYVGHWILHRIFEAHIHNTGRCSICFSFTLLQLLFPCHFHFAFNWIFLYIGFKNYSLTPLLASVPSIWCRSFCRFFLKTFLFHLPFFSHGWPSIGISVLSGRQIRDSFRCEQNFYIVQFGFQYMVNTQSLVWCIRCSVVGVRCSMFMYTVKSARIKNNIQ